MSGAKDGAPLLLSALLMVFPTIAANRWVKGRAAGTADHADSLEEPGLATFIVRYLGGHPLYPGGRPEQIELTVAADRFRLAPTEAARHWFDSLDIQYGHVIDVRITERVVGTVETLLGGLNAGLLAQPNNIHIEYHDGEGNELVLRLEMLTGVTVTAQAAMCREFEDLLRTSGVRRLFRAARAPAGREDIAARLETLAQLRATGVITDAEFGAKKANLLAQL